MGAGSAGSGYVLVLFLLVPLAGFVLFVILHLRPLKGSDLELLAAKRRARKIEGYFTFSKSEFEPNLDFKRRMASSGQFYNVREGLSSFPSLAASLLKYKKHEWILVAMEKNREIGLMWLNKGADGTRVGLRMPFELAERIARANGYTSLLIFHNHPNPDPSTYSCRHPSSADLNSAARWGKTLSTHGLNLVEFICERGIPYRYWFSVADEFLPVSDFLQTLRNENGISRFKNFSLHMERIF